MISIHELLIQFIYKYKITFIFYIVFTAILYPLHHIIMPDYYGKVISSFKDKTNLFDMVKMLLYLYIITRFIDDIVLYFQYLIVPNFSEYITGKIFSFILNNYDYDFENIKVGEIISKMTKMPDILFDYVDVFRIDVLKQIFVFGAALLHYITISKTIVNVFIVYIIIHYIYFFIMFKSFYSYNKEVNIFQDNVYEYLNDTMQNMSSVYSLNQQEYEKKRFYDHSFKDYKKIFGASYLAYLYSYGAWALVNISMFIIMNYILYKSYKNKKITSGQLVSSFVITWSILSLYQKAIDSAWNLSAVWGSLFNAQDFFNKTYNNNKSVKSLKSPKGPNSVNSDKESGLGFKNGDIVISSVYHKYSLGDASNDFVLENISMKIKKGEKIAFVGKIGSGKSTLIKLIMGYQPLILGSITIGGVSINEISNDEIRKNIFYIPQKPKLFNRTLYENIIYGIEKSKQPTKDQIYDIMSLYGLSFGIDIDENVGLEGNSISGGQRQMVWLLRSLLSSAYILIMDEPTSALDPDNKKLITSIIKKISVGKTVIIVSHDSIDPEFKQIHFTDGRLHNY